ncbi:MRG-domain-containing protein [Gloeophyllum trabeum ATCC 11539]|uniref:Chromatin modification-related protein EAF3 n=1 Tax=Gloeophyllum trabeum (strain ATCC 11539 / FP-39264 / Madison 617) TaxID=670483 RepID=S7Q0H5_GLOTA|nr:MRG-domain-containing protein [Gloeophyllum trabeum ATCC 11539]EPQ53213.1 MRG-domain-containing protein [Gloeophyllum trabeum ATCC 11539]
MATSAPTYAVNERVLCYHGPLIYEAKILKVENWDETTTQLGSVGPHYFVHYKGWKQTWDEWVPASRLLKYNEASIQLQKQLKEQASAQASGSSAKAKAGAHKDGAKAVGTGRKEGGTRGTKRGREEDEGSKKPEMKLNVPEILKVILVDDWEAVTKNNQLVPLPRTPNVVELLEEFKEYVLALPPGATNLRDPKLVLPTIISGLQVYFDRSLGQNLLYRFERPQYAEIRRQFVTGPTVKVGQEKEMSAIYGAEHLLRMLVSMPQMVANSTMDPESVSIVRDYVNELMQWMVKEKDRIFQREYESASLQYQNISRS